MVGLEFVKMSGHGNDFVLVDNRDRKVETADMAGLARAVCRRQLSVGADGIVFIEDGPAEVNFAWRFYNSDGSEAEMCGNAARCAARFAYMCGIAPAEMSFLTLAGIIRAEVGPDTVKAQLTPPGRPDMDYVLDLNGRRVIFSSINTGVPHAVTWVDDLESINVFEMGRAVRLHPRFQPAGTNVNFTRFLDRDRMAVRTYERGVEDETLACGTGVTAAVLLSALKGQVDSPTRVLTRGGQDLVVHFSKSGQDFGEVFLEGQVRLVFSGRLGSDALLE